VVAIKNAELVTMIAALPHKNCMVLMLEAGELSTDHGDLLHMEILETAARQLKIPILNFRNDWIDSILLNDLLEKLKSLSGGDKTSLLISGRYLEEQVTVCALEALAQGFDVYLLMDMIAPRNQNAKQAIEVRLYQAGAVPTSLGQFIYLWFYAETEVADKLILQKLFAQYNKANECASAAQTGLS
jgi:hypothetical protein